MVIDRPFFYVLSCEYSDVFAYVKQKEKKRLGFPSRKLD